jgi:periplasmic divalent cation tolerance protein
MDKPVEFIQVVVAFDSRQGALDAARRLVERRLAACAQVVGPVESVYRWQGAVETAQEHLLLIKTATGKFGGVERAILDAHPYSTPEILAFPVVGGAEGYLAWLRDSLSGEAPAG